MVWDSYFYVLLGLRLRPLLSKGQKLEVHNLLDPHEAFCISQGPQVLLSETQTSVGSTWSFLLFGGVPWVSNSDQICLLTSK